MAEREKMSCPDCGVDMNCHAEKVNYTAEPAETEMLDPSLGGVIEEFHTCPECGNTHSRPAG